VNRAGNGRRHAGDSPSALLHWLRMPPPEPSTHLETTAALQARKIRFEALTGWCFVGVEGTYGIIRPPAPPWRLPRARRRPGW